MKTLKYLGTEAFEENKRCLYRGFKKAYKTTTDFLSENIYRVAIAGIPVGMTMALSDIDNVKEVGYCMIGAGTAELIECVKNKKNSKKHTMLMREISRLRKDIKEVKELEEEEISLLSEDLEGEIIRFIK